MAAELDGPRLEPRAGAARQLVVFLHGYGADGNDLIDIGRAWQGLLPDAAFVSPHAPRPCGQDRLARDPFPRGPVRVLRDVLGDRNCDIARESDLPQHDGQHGAIAAIEMANQLGFDGVAHEAA